MGIGRGRGDHGSKVTSGGEQARWTHGIEAFRSVGGSLSHGRATGGRMPRSHHDFFLPIVLFSCREESRDFYRCSLNLDASRYSFPETFHFTQPSLEI